MGKNGVLSNRMAVALVVMLFSLGSSSLIPVARAQSEDRWYAGYCYTLSEGNPPPNGVRGLIKTIDPWVEEGHFFAQWVTVVLNYYYGYWIQSGYTKGYDTGYWLKWYCEVNDEFGWSLIFIPGLGPAPCNTYQYYIEKYNNRWTCGVTDEWNRDVGVRSPNDARDYQALSEMTWPTIRIWGTHFSDLSMWNSDYVWVHWDRHVLIEDYPYFVWWEVSDYEFYAGGGAK